MKNKTTILLFFIILLAALIRFYRFYDLAVFLADQASDSTQVLNILKGDFTLLGPISSVGGFYNGPIVYYLMLPFYWIFGADPIAGTVFQSTLSVATIPFIYLLGKRIKNVQVGLIAAFLFAISPLMVDYSRAAFNAYPAIFFSTVILFLLSGLINRFSMTKTIAMGVLTGFILQMHYLTTALLILVLLYPVIFEKKLMKLKYYVSLVLGVGIGLSPFLLFELKHQFLNTNLIIQYFTSAQAGGKSRSMHYIFTIWPEITGILLLGNNYVAGIIGSIVLTGFTITAYRKELVKRQYLNMFVFLFLIVFFIGLIFGRKMQTHYVISLHTSLILFFAIGMNYLLKEKKIFIAIMCGLLLIVNSYSWNFKKDMHPVQRGLNIPDFKKAAQIIRNDKKNTYNVAMHAQGDNRAMPLRYTLNLANETFLPYEDYGGAQHLYFIIPKKEQIKDQKMWEYTSFGPSQVVYRWDLNKNYFLYKLNKKI